MNKKLIVPTVFATDAASFAERFAKVTAISKHVHIDIMDGEFVQARSPGLSELALPADKTLHIEAHLMVNKPGDYLEGLHTLQIKKVIFHVDSLATEGACNELIASIKQLGMSPFIAVNPEIPIARVFPFLETIDGVLVMGVHPGEEHQEFIEETFIKLAALKTHIHSDKIAIQVDGGINTQNISKLAHLGVTIFNVGSYIATSHNPKKAMKDLEIAMNTPLPKKLQHPAVAAKTAKVTAAKTKGKSGKKSKKK